MSRVGIVAIGRNEGERLARCLDSVVAMGGGGPLVYVDSASTDGSAALARARGAAVVELDPDLPLTAARARNAGFERALALDPAVELVQFVDGDCEIAPGWLERATDAIEGRQDAAVVCGRRRERHPERSVYNRLCDLEWSTPVGEAKACGGDALVRVRAFREVGGFDPVVIAGEEPELCLRLRRRGWKVLRIDADMTVHDAAITRFGQWWRRAVRAGHAYAQGAFLHGRSAERHYVRESASIALFALLVPAVAAATAWPTGGSSLALLAAYPLLAARIFRAGRRRGLARPEAALHAGSCVLGKWPQLLGWLTFAVASAAKRPARGAIEYKDGPERVSGRCARGRA